MPAFPGKGEPSTNSSLASQVVRDRLDALHEGDFEPLRVSQQATPNMTVLVQQDRGHAYVDGNNPLDFAGGNSPAFTAPAGAGERRIDLLHIDKTGTLEITQGTATVGTPVAPQYPTNKMVLAEIYLRQGMTVIKDTDDTINGYILQRRQPLVSLGGGLRILSKVTTDVVVNNTAAEIDIFNFTVPGGVLGTNNSLRLSLGGVINAGSSSSLLLTFRFKYGATIVGSATFTATTNDVSVTNQPFYVTGFLMGKGATNAQRCHGIVSSHNVQGLNVIEHTIATRGIAAEDSTTSNDFELTVQFNSAFGGTLTMESATLEHIT